MIMFEYAELVYSKLLIATQHSNVDTRLVPVDTRLVPVDTRLVPVDTRLVPVDTRLVSEPFEIDPRQRATVPTPT